MATKSSSPDVVKQLSGSRQPARRGDALLQALMRRRKPRKSKSKETSNG